MKQHWVLTYIDWTFPFKMILGVCLFFFFFMPSSLFWLPGVYSWVRQGFRRTPLYPPLPIGIWWECSVSQRWGGGEPLFYLVQMPHQLSLRERERETSYWSGGVNSACRNLSRSPFKRLESVTLETSFSRVLGPVFVALPKSSVKSRPGALSQ